MKHERSAWHHIPRQLDARAARAPHWLRVGSYAVTCLAIILQSLPHVPRAFVDYRKIPILRGISQPEMFGTDTIADSYEARVVRNSVADMYTKTLVEQTPDEAATWSKPASAPYPPAVLLCEAALSAVGDVLGIGLYGMILLCAIAFIGLSALYFFQTRWYLFPVLYLNFAYFSGRFVEVQDGSYLVMLVTVMAALWAARRQRPICHALVALAAVMKLSPLYYVRHLGVMGRRSAAGVLAILVAGLVLPWLVWENYSYIYLFHDGLKGGRGGLIAGILIGGLFTLLLAYVESRTRDDWEDRIGWSLVPVALFLAMKMNVPRHVLIVLLVPDKQAWRNLIAAFALAVPVLIPGIRFGATLPIATVLLFGALGWRLAGVGWSTVADDWRHPARTLRALLVGAHDRREPTLPIA